MALDPAVLKARIDLRICELKLLAAWITLNWRGRAEPEHRAVCRRLLHAAMKTTSDKRATAALLIATIEAALETARPTGRP